MGKPIANPGGSVEALGPAISFIDGPGIFIDYDASTTVARIAAKAGGAGGSNGLRIFTMFAGGPRLALDFAASGIINVTQGGVQFPATQIPSNDPNTLDDYEEGTFLPSITFGGFGVGITYTIQTGIYTKIGRLVYFKSDLLLTSKGSSTGVVRMNGLPFTPGAETYSTLSVGYADALTSISGHLGAITAQGVATIEISQSGTGSLTDLTNANFTNATRIMIGGCYTI